MQIVADRGVDAIVQQNRRLNQQRTFLLYLGNQQRARFRDALQNVVNTVDNNFERSQSWCLKLISNIINLVLPQEDAQYWEKWIYKAYEKSKSSNWKQVVRQLIGAIIGWLIAQLLFYDFGNSQFVAGLVETYKWVKTVVLQWGSKILGGLGALWNTLFEYLNKV